MLAFCGGRARTRGNNAAHDHEPCQVLSGSLNESAQVPGPPWLGLPNAVQRRRSDALGRGGAGLSCCRLRNHSRRAQLAASMPRHAKNSPTIATNIREYAQISFTMPDLQPGTARPRCSRATPVLGRNHLRIMPHGADPVYGLPVYALTRAGSARVRHLSCRIDRSRRRYAHGEQRAAGRPQVACSPWRTCPR